MRLTEVSGSQPGPYQFQVHGAQAPAPSFTGKGTWALIYGLCFSPQASSSGLLRSRPWEAVKKAFGVKRVWSVPKHVPLALQMPYLK
jgi:hypothetical protein